MAVTITKSPQAYTPSDNPVAWTFNSDQFAQDNFSFLVEVYVNAVLRSSHQIFPEIASNTAHFDAEAEKITNVICSHPDPDVTTFTKDAANHAVIYIKVIEVYGDPATQHASATSSNVTVFKSSLSDDDFIDFDYTRFAFGAGAMDWMTFFPEDEKYYCSTTENLWALFLTNNSSVQLQITVVQPGGSSATQVVNTAASLSSIKFLLVNASPQSLADNSPFSISDFETAEYYELKMKNGATLSKVFRVYIDNTCDAYGTKRLHFLSSIGSIESFSFTKNNDESREIKSHGYEKQWGAFNDSNEWSFDQTQGREIDYLKTSQGKLRCVSDWLTELVQNWLVRELYESSYVLLEVDSDTELKRVKVANTSSKKAKNVNGRLIQEFIELNTSDYRKSALI